MRPPGVVDRAADGTPLCAPRGELPLDADGQRVQCHLCGGWYRTLGSSHLPRKHGLTADAYRELVGLLPRHALWAPDLSDRQGARLRARILTDPRLRAAAEKGRARAGRRAAARRACAAGRAAGEPGARASARTVRGAVGQRARRVSSPAPRAARDRARAR